MDRPHAHTSDCPAHCSRLWDLDERTSTAAYRIVARHAYGNRPKKDKPRWWPFAFHAYKALIQLLGAAGLLWLAKKCGLGGSP